MKNAKIFVIIWLIVAATALIGFAVIVRPTGEIHSSVNAMVAEIFATALAFAGITTWHEKNNK